MLMKKFTHTEKMGPLHALALETEAEKERFNSLLDDGHYLKSRQPSGNTLYQAVLDEAGEWVAIVLWCGGSYRIDPRDTFIGWDGKKREERHGLVTQCSRFMVLDAKRSPNVASQAMGAALRALPGQFAAKYGYAPALAESFSDPELHAGTLYLATGWTKLALSKGFSRDYADYYVRNDRPKVLWVKPLRDGWKEAMCGTALQAADAAVLRPSRLLPFRDDRVESLFGALMGIPDRRRVNRHIPQATVLCVIVLAMLCGRSKVSEFVRFAQGLTPEQKLLLGFPRLKKNRRICKAPSRKTFDAVLKGVSPVRLSEALDGWFRDSLGEMPPALALDGKYVREKVGTLNVCDTHGRTVCSAPIKKKGRSPLSPAPR